MMPRFWKTLAAAAVVAGVMAGTAPGMALAQQNTVERPETINGKPNINGIWQVLNSANWALEAHDARAFEQFYELGAIGARPGGLSVVEGGEIPYLPDALEQREENRANWPEADPETYCYLPGIPRATYMPYPFQIVQGGGDIYFAYEYASANRMVHIEEHVDAPVPTWMGYSNGEWDGDTLVVETTGFNGKTWLDRSGNFISADATVTERFTPMDDSHMRYEATIDDPATFSRPWTISMTLYRNVEPDAQLMEFRCVPFAEKLRYIDLERGADEDAE